MALTDIDGQRLGDSVADKLGDRNLIINGAMNVWQRGTSQTTSGSYGADRFWMSSASSAARSTDAPAGFTYSTKLTHSASDMSMGQPIELPATGKQGQLVAGTTVTLTYYAKVDSGTEAIGTAINFRDSKFSGTNEVAFTSSNANATWTTTWTRYEHQFTVPTVAGTNVLAGLEITGISKDAYVTGVQLEVGNTATPFQHEPYAKTLAKCMRYYQKYTSSLNGFGISGAGYCETSTQTEFIFFLTVPMRTLASANITEIGDLEVKVGSLNFDVTGLDGVAFNDNFSLATVRTTNSNSGASAGTVARLRANGAGAGFQFNAEL